MRVAQTGTADVDQACVTPAHRRGCMLRPRNHSRAAVLIEMAESLSMLLGEDVPHVVVAVGMDRVAVQGCTKKSGDLDSRRGLEADTAGGYHIDCARIRLDIGDHIDCNASGEAGHMDSVRRVALRKGCIRRCNGHVVPRPPWYRSEPILKARLFTYLLIVGHVGAFGFVAARVCL